LLLLLSQPFGLPSLLFILSPTLSTYSFYFYFYREKGKGRRGRGVDLVETGRRGRKVRRTKWGG